MKNIANDTAVRYTVSVTVTRPVEYDRELPMAEQAEWRLSADAKRELVREVMLVLRKLEGDCDCEVMEAELVAE